MPGVNFVMLSSTRMRIPEMKSVDTTRAVSDALVAVQGVADIGVDADQGLVEVRYDPGKTNEDQICDAVRQAGFAPQK